MAPRAAGLTWGRAVAVSVAAPIFLTFCAAQSGTQGSEEPASAANGASRDADDLLIVDCLLPGKVRKLGTRVTYQTPRRAIKTPARDCAIRGGEYTAADRASYETALAIWLEQAKQGDPAAQNYVGEIYERGLGTQPDHGAAAHWYRQAADQGYESAQINLGQLYERGLGVPKDRAAALKWYRKASGLPDFVPSAAVEGAGGRDPEVQRLRRELSDRDREVEELQKRLRSLQQQSGAGSASQAAAEAARRKQISDLEAEIERLAQTTSDLRQQIASRPKLASRVGEPVPGPIIAMLDPQLYATRGVQIVQTTSTEMEHTIVGRVEAPAGLASLTVNDNEAGVSDSGIFRGSVRVESGRSEVTIIAVDRQGKRAQRQFAIESAASGEPGSRVELRSQPPRLRADFGRYHALVIGNNAYTHLPALATARADAAAVAEVLEQRYGFRVKTLYDATRYDILSALNDLRADLEKNDNLLVYYAGHGELDKVNDRGHWLPVDAEPQSSANWISNIALTDVLNAMNANHVIVVADSCYSGALTRSSLPRLDADMSEKARANWVRSMVAKRSRTALTSGGVAPVLDTGGSKHSIFARALLDVLRTNREVMEGQRLFQHLSARVTWAAEARKFKQTPRYAPIRFSQHESGDFFFVPSG
jgi:uncharacterized caspase-like protein